jgi:hypothetical protein
LTGSNKREENATATRVVFDSVFYCKLEVPGPFGPRGITTSASLRMNNAAFERLLWLAFNGLTVEVLAAVDLDLMWGWSTE